MLNSEVFVADDVESLSRLLRSRAGARCTLTLPELTDDENRSFERRINKLRAACGCPEGAAAMLLSLAGYAAVVWLGDYHPSQRILAKLGLGLALMIAALITGKVFGLLLARYRLSRLEQLLLRRLAHLEALPSTTRRESITPTHET